MEFNAFTEGDGSDGENTADTVQMPNSTLEYEGGYPKIPDPDKLAHKEMQAALREIFTFHYREFVAAQIVCLK